jgi:hypothetical protein
MIVGGMKKYLAKVQAMPPEVEERTKEIIHDFLWEEAHQGQ